MEAITFTPAQVHVFNLVSHIKSAVWVRGRFCDPLKNNCRMPQGQVTDILMLMVGHKGV